MKPEIKKRIEQFNNGETPEGYKKTDFGVFPSEWETVFLGNLMDFKNGINANKEKYNNGIKMISVSDILTDLPIVYNSIQGQVDIDEDTLKKYDVTYGDVLFQRSSETFEDAGKSNVFLDHNVTATYSGFVIRGKKKAEYEPYYVNEALRIEKVRKQIITRAAGSQHINVGQDSLASIVIPFASLYEQSRIAEVLTKWDVMIELQKQYIKKLETLRIAYIQSFFRKHNDWEEFKLIDCIIDSNERVGERKIEPVAVGVMGIRKRSEIFEKELSNDYSHNKVFRLNQLCFGIGTNKIVCDVLLEDVIYCVSPAYRVFNVGSKIDPYFLKCLLDYNNRRLSNKYMIISARQGKSIEFEGLLTEKLYRPNISIQKDFVLRIIAIDGNISLQKEKLKAIMLQRKALQQYLLNGIVRVR